MRTNNSIALDFKGIDLTGESLVLTGACDTLKRAHLASGFLICCGMLIAGVAGEACVCRYDLAITYTEPESEDEEPEEIDTAHIYACNGYDLTIVNDAVTAVAAPNASAIDARVTAIEGVVDTANDKLIVDEITSTGDSVNASKPIIEDMVGYTFFAGTPSGLDVNISYAGAVKNGNKLTLALAFSLVRNDTIGGNRNICVFEVPQDVMAKLFPTTITNLSILDEKEIKAIYDVNEELVALNAYLVKATRLDLYITANTLNNLTLNTMYYLRYEVTFLLSDNLAA